MRYWNSEFLNRLLEVQDTDLKIRELYQQIDEIYQKSKEEDAQLVRLRNDLGSIEEVSETTSSQHQMYSGTLEDVRSAIKGLLTTKSGAPKPRTRSSTEALRIEEEKLTLLVAETEEQLKSLEIERVKILESIEQRTIEVHKLQQGPEASIRKIQNKIRRFENQRKKDVEDMPAMLLRRYDRLRSSRSGIGLTVLKNGVCTVCRMQMPTAIVARLNNGERIIDCPACGRMVARIELAPDLVVNVPKDETSSSESKQKEEQQATESPLEKAEPKKETKVKKKTTKKKTAQKKTTKKTVAKKTPAKKNLEKKKTVSKVPAEK